TDAFNHFPAVDFRQITDILQKLIIVSRQGERSCELCLAAVIEGDDEIIEPADFIGTEMWMGFINHIQLAGVDKTILMNIVICATLLPEMQLELTSHRHRQFFFLTYI